MSDKESTKYWVQIRLEGAPGTAAEYGDWLVDPAWTIMQFHDVPSSDLMALIAHALDIEDGADIEVKHEDAGTGARRMLWKGKAPPPQNLWVTDPAN